MPKYKRQKVKITGAEIGEPEFWVELHDIRSWPTKRLEDLQNLSSGDTAAITSGAEVSPEQDKKLFDQAQEFFAELVYDWNLVDTEDEADEPAVLPLPAEDTESIQKIPIGFLLIVTKQMQKLMEQISVPLARETPS